MDHYSGYGGEKYNFPVNRLNNCLFKGLRCFFSCFYDYSLQTISINLLYYTYKHFVQGAESWLTVKKGNLFIKKCQSISDKFYYFIMCYAILVKDCLKTMVCIGKLC